MDLSGGDLTQKIIACEHAVHNKFGCLLFRKGEQDAGGRTGFSRTEDQPVAATVNIRSGCTKIL